MNLNNIMTVLLLGLFHRAIMQSGCTLNPWAVGDRTAVQVAKALGYDSENERDVLNFLRSVPAEKFLDVVDIVKDVNMKCFNNMHILCLEYFLGSGCRRSSTIWTRN